MADYQKYINALRKCAKEHDNDKTSTGHIRVSDLCRDTANLLEEVEQEPVFFPPCQDCNTKMDEIRRTYDKLQKPSGDAIDRKLVCAFIDGLISDDEERKKGLEYIRNMPPVNPVKTGHWIADPQNLQTTTEYYYICSECGRRIHLLYPATLNDYPYCHCGANMVESQERSNKG